MKQLGNFQFPDNPNEARNWEPYISVKALNRDVLVVAKTRVEGTWCAYCGAVPGKSHTEEWREVADHGSKLLEEYARAMFKEFEDIPYAR